VSTRSKVSLELVGEFFEVRTQVDRDLTTVSRVDRRLGLIKNLGRHMPVLSVHPTACFESFGHRTHPTHLVSRASNHQML
jgi:hypothetical protein